MLRWQSLENQEMTMKKTTLLLSLLLASAAFADDKKPAKPAKDTKKPSIEICFVLDTTGSMSGLIAGAKQKIWSVANMMISGKPTPKIKIGLIGYRDKTDAYITKTYPLSEDIDDIYAKLTAFQAQGGGDTPEAVNQALHEAVHKMKWSKSRDVLKIIFLVGDAPPHMDYKQDVKYPVTCEQAAKADIIINTIQCGRMASTTPIWKEIAEHNVALNATVTGYGTVVMQKAAVAKARSAEAAPKEAAADRATYFLRSASPSLKSAPVISGGGDLTELLANKKLDLKDIEEKKLPENVRKMKPKEREAYLKKQVENRNKAQAELKGLLKKRADFIAKKNAELKKAGKLKGFDAKVQNLIREQAAPKGIAY